MTLTWKSRVVSASGRDPARPEVRPAHTCATLGTSSDRGAAATVTPHRFAGRPVGVLLGVAAAGLLGLAGCDLRESGNGVYHEQIIHVGDFAGVRMQDGIDAVISVTSTATQTVALTGDENIVKENLRTSIEPETVGSATVPVLHVWSSGSFTPVIPPRVLITRSTLVVVRGTGSLDIHVTGTPGRTAPGPLHVALDGASLTAGDYAVDGAVVELDRAARAVLHADGPVTGGVSADSHLDNSRGTGPCSVETSGSGSVVCD